MLETFFYSRAWGSNVYYADDTNSSILAYKALCCSGLSRRTKNVTVVQGNTFASYYDLCWSGHSVRPTKGTHWRLVIDGRAVPESRDIGRSLSWRRNGCSSVPVFSMPRSTLLPLVLAYLKRSQLVGQPRGMLKASHPSHTLFVLSSAHKDVEMLSFR